MNCDCRTHVCVHDAARDYGREWSEVDVEKFGSIVMQAILISVSLNLWIAISTLKPSHFDQFWTVIGCVIMSLLNTLAISICWNRLTRRR